MLNGGKRTSMSVLLLADARSRCVTIHAWALTTLGLARFWWMCHHSHEH